MGKSAVNRLRLFSIARFDHQRVSSICPQSPRASEDDCSRHADDFGTFQARNPKKRSSIFAMFVSQIPSRWKLESHSCSKNHMFICCCFNSMFFLYIVSCLLDFQDPSCGLARLRAWETLTLFRDTTNCVGQAGSGPPLKAFETQWNLASTWGFHQQNMGDFPKKHENIRISSTKYGEVTIKDRGKLVMGSFMP